MRPSDGVPDDSLSAIEHCFRCDLAVTVLAPQGEEALRCPECDDTLLGPPGGSRLIRWSPADEFPRPVDDDGRRDAPLDRTRRTSASMLAGGMLGLQQALFGPIDDDAPVVFVDERPEPESDVDVHLDEKPSRSWVRFRRDPTPED